MKEKKGNESFYFLAVVSLLTTVSYLLKRLFFGKVGGGETPTIDVVKLEKTPETNTKLSTVDNTQLSQVKTTSQSAVLPTNQKRPPALLSLSSEERGKQSEADIPLALCPLPDSQTPLSSCSPSKVDAELDESWGTLTEKDRLALNFPLLKFGILLAVPSNSAVEFRESKARVSEVPLPPPGKTTHSRPKSVKPSEPTAAATVVGGEKTDSKPSIVKSLKSDSTSVATVVDSEKTDLKQSLVKSPQFLFGNRSFSVEQFLCNDEDSKLKIGCGALQNIFSDFIAKKNPKNNPLVVNGGIEIGEKKPTVRVYRPDNRDEEFFPVGAGYDNQGNLTGVFAYMWSVDSDGVLFHPKNRNKKSAQPFTGFDTFVSAMCMYGTHIVGCNQKGVQRPLIKHDNPYFKDEMIVRVLALQDSNPYETLVFKELEIYLQMIDNYTKNGAPKTFFCHVPWADYMLIGIDLYLKNRITPAALGQFFKLILQKGKEYKDRIEKACLKHNINVEILSPLSSLFTSFQLSNIGGIKGKRPHNKSDNDFAIDVLNDLGLDSAWLQSTQVQTMQNEATQDQTMQDQAMRKFVDGLVIKLKSASHPHSQLWAKILASEDITKKIKTIEDLFDIANAFVIARATDGKPRDGVCSILPLSEKPIQIEYKKIANKLSLPSAFFITIFDSIIVYDLANDTGLLFYHQNNYRDLENLEKDEVLHEVRKRVGFFAQHRKDGQPPIMLKRIESLDDSIRVMNLAMNHVVEAADSNLAMLPFK